MKRIIAAMLFCKNDEKRYAHVWFHMFVFPFLLLAPMAFMMKYLSIGITEVYFIIIGVIIWRFVYLAQAGISYSLLVPVWHRTIRSFEASPIKDYEFFLGFWLFWFSISIIVTIFLSIIAWFILGFNILQGGIMIIPVFLVFGLMGIPLGLITLSVVYSLGIKADLIAWSITDIIIFLSGVLYPVVVFPEWLQTISYALPSTWGLISIRSLFTGSFDWFAFQTFIVLTLLFVGVMWVVYRKCKNRALKNGFMQKYM